MAPQRSGALLKILKRLDRYLISELAKATFVASLIAVVVLLALQILRLSDLMIHHDLGFRIIGKMLLGLGLSFTPLVIPIAFLFAMLLVFGRMSTEREFIAMQAMGKSPSRLVVPCLYFGGIMVLISLWFSFDMGPRGNRLFEATIDEAFKKKVMSVLRSGTFSEGFLNMVIFVDDVDPVSQELHRVFIHDEQSFQEEVSISAKTGKWIQSDEKQMGVLKLKEGVMLSQNNQKNIVRRINFDEYRLNADFSREAGRSRDSPPSLGWNRLLEKRREILQAAEIDGREIWIEIARRFSLSALCLFFVPLAFALSIDNRRTAKSRAVFSGLIIIAGYWSAYFMIVSTILGTQFRLFKHHEFPNWLVVWIPSLIVLWAGFVLLKQKNKLSI